MGNIKIHGCLCGHEWASRLGRRPVACPKCGDHNFDNPAKFGTRSRREWTSSEDSLLGTDLDRAIAERLKRTYKSVKDRRENLGIKPFKPYRIEWTEEHLALLGKMPDVKLAAKIGCTASSVGNKRRKIGIKSYQEG